MNNEKKGYALIGDLLNIDDFISYEIIDGYNFKKANSNQIDEIKAIIPNVNTFFPFLIRYESKRVYKDDNTCTFVSLDKDYWNYWVIEYNDTQVKENIYIALYLSANLTCLFELINSGEGGGKLTHPQRLFNFIIDNQMRYDEKKITSSDLLDVRNTYHLIERIEENELEYKYIKKAIHDFYNLTLIPRANPFFIVGIFSIMETLLVSSQKVDRITHQLKMKLNLIYNRIDKNINYLNYFNCPDSLLFITLIEKLYSYRSDIAHGDFADFNNDLQIIANQKQSRDFLYDLVKRILKQALLEPKLIMDLKNC